MSKVLTDNQYYGQIANIIREQNGTNNTYTPPQMVSALKDLFYEEVEGVPPISFNGIGENLLDYRIDGASGGVGDRTDNLFNGILLDGYYTDNTLTTLTSTNGIYKSLKITLPAGTYTVVYSEAILIIRYIELNGDYMTNPAGQSTVKSYTFTLNSESTVGLCFRNSSNTEWNDSIKIQIEEGSTPTDYEPYGYKIPVVVSGKNLFDGIYGANHFSKIEPDKTITISTKSTGESSITFVYKKSDGTRFGYTRLLNENETSGSVTVTTPSEAVGIGIYAATNYTSQTIAYDTLIEYGDRATTYKEYIEPTTTNIYLDKPLEAKANIPNEYTEVEYLESTGTQYIDTNYTPVQGDDLEFKNVTINTFNGALFSAGIGSYQLILLGLGSVCYYFKQETQLQVLFQL